MSAPDEASVEFDDDCNDAKKKVAAPIPSAPVDAGQAKAPTAAPSPAKTNQQPIGGVQKVRATQMKRIEWKKIDAKSDSCAAENYAWDDEITVHVAVANKDKDFSAAFSYEVFKDRETIFLCKLPDVTELGQGQLRSLQIVLNHVLKRNPGTRPVKIRSDLALGFDSKRIREPLFEKEFRELRSLVKSFAKISFEYLFTEIDNIVHGELLDDALSHASGVSPDGTEIKSRKEEIPDFKPDMMIAVATAFVGNGAAMGAYFVNNPDLNFSQRLPGSVSDRGLADVVALQMAMHQVTKNCNKPVKSLMIYSVLKHVMDEHRYKTDHNFAYEYEETKKMMNECDVMLVEQEGKNGPEYSEAEKMARAELQKVFEPLGGRSLLKK